MYAPPCMPLRLLSRAAPLMLGAVAAALWLRRRPPERPALHPGEAPAPPRRAPEAREIDIVAVVDDLLRRP
jgi:hypothetical protein